VSDRQAVSETGFFGLLYPRITQLVKFIFSGTAGGGTVFALFAGPVVIAFNGAATDNWGKRSLAVLPPGF
jgi:hypothetical protein